MHNQHKDQILNQFQIVCNISSVFGSAFIIILFLTIKKLQFFALKIVFFISVSDLLLALNMLMVSNTNSMDNQETICQVQSFIQSWAGLSSIFWTNTMIYSLKYSIIDQKVDLKKKLPYMLYLNFVTTFLFSSIPCFFKQYGIENMNDCWINKQKRYPQDQIALMIILYYLPLLINVIYALITFYELNQFLQGTQNHKVLKFVHGFFYYPLFMSFQFIFAVIDNIIIDDDNDHDFVLRYFHVFFSYTQGFSNALIFGLTNQHIKKQIKYFFYELLHFRKRQKCSNITQSQLQIDFF